LNLALRQSQERNEKLEREIELMSRRLSTTSTRSNHGTKAYGTPDSTDTVASNSGRESVSASAYSSTKIIAGSNTGGNASKPKPSVTNALKEKTRFFSAQSSLYEKFSSNPGQEMKKAFSSNTRGSDCIDSSNNPKVETAAEGSPSDQSIISAMAWKFSNLHVKAKKDFSTERKELEAIRQTHLQGKVRGSKIWLENAFTQMPKTPYAAWAEIGEDGDFISPLRARIDLLGQEGLEFEPQVK